MFLKHIEISQVQCIERVTLDFSRATGGNAEANPGLKAESRARARMSWSTLKQKQALFSSSTELRGASVCSDE